MTFPRYKPGPVEYWLAAAFTEFVNGCIAGAGSGCFVGAGTGGAAATPVGDALTPSQKGLMTIAAVLLTMAGNGVKRVVVWHDSNPFPNPYPKPTEPPQSTPTERP